MDQEDLLSKLEKIVADDPRYKLEAYVFVIDALESTMSRLRRTGHVSGAELLEGIKNLAREEFGLTARMVFDSWGVRRTEDFGEIVFALVNAGILGKDERDSKEDFIGVYDFDDVFEKQYDWDIENVS